MIQKSLFNNVIYQRVQVIQDVIKNSNLDNLIQQFSTTYDLKQRQQLAIQASEMILDDAANIYVS